jgi:hypothetical protein
MCTRKVDVKEFQKSGILRHNLEDILAGESFIPKPFLELAQNLLMICVILLEDGRERDILTSYSQNEIESLPRRFKK